MNTKIKLVVWASAILIAIYPLPAASETSWGSLLLNGGCITSGNQAISLNTAPSTITATPATGGNCQAYQYQWQVSIDNVHFYNIPAATFQNLTYDTPLTRTTYFHRKTTCGIDVKFTASVVVTMTNSITYYSAAINANYLSQSCPSGQLPNSYPVNIASGTYTSTTSQAAADAQAQSAAQNQANQSGTCSAPVIYARIEVENENGPTYDVQYHWDGSRTESTTRRGDVVVKFYSDATCTQALTLSSAMTVNWSTGGFMETSYAYYSYPNSLSTSVPSGVSSYVLEYDTSLGGSNYWFDEYNNLQEYEYWRDYYYLATNGSVYTIVQPNQVPANW